MFRIREVAVASAFLAAVGVAVPQEAGAQPRAAHSQPSPVVVVSGLNNPRQLQLVGGTSQLLIAEAGKGGDTPVPGPPGQDTTYVGATGSISAVWLPRRAHDTTPNRIVTGLMSAAGQDGSFAVGSDGVAARRPRGPIYIQETYAPADVLPAPFGTTQDGRLLAARPYGSTLRTVADISAYELANDPDGHGPDSDPYAVIARRHDLLVADAAGNDVLRVDRWGHVHLFHVFPNVTTGACASQSDPGPAFPGCNYVPTSLATDRRGHVYVGGLSSETPGEGRVTELSADGRHVLRTWTGFSSVTGVAVDHRGTLYVSQLEAPEQNPIDPRVSGVLTRVRGNQRTNVDVPFPAGVAVDSCGDVFVSAWSVASEAGLAGPTTSGQVWRLRM